jgi:hypothetical protein
LRRAPFFTVCHWPLFVFPPVLNAFPSTAFLILVRSWNCCSPLVWNWPGSKGRRLLGVVYPFDEYPSQLEVIESGTFNHCHALSQLIFEFRSRLRKLLLVPASDFGVLNSLDSVEMFWPVVPGRRGPSRLREFDRGSHLRKIGFCRDRTSYHPGYGRWDESCCAFVGLAEEILRRFRCKFEDEWGWAPPKQAFDRIH